MKIKVLFMGRKQVAFDCLKHLLNKDNVEIVGVLRRDTAKPAIADLAIDEDLPLLNFDSALMAIESNELVFDIGFSVLYQRKLPDQFISSPTLGVINFHPAILPDYKGTAGYNLAILEGRSDWGVSAHYMDHEIDTGEIIEVTRFPISYEMETAQSLERKCQKFIFEQFTESLIALSRKR